MCMNPEFDKGEPVLEEVEVEIDKVALMGLAIRDNSYEYRLTNAEDFLEEPFFLDVEEVLTLIDELKAREDYKDICIKKGAESIYLFSENHITENYANMMIMVEEKDLLKLVTETVREESRVYPRPTNSRLFLRSPFNLKIEELLQVLELLKKNESYNDIQETRASNKALYLYSDKFLKEAHANSLAEWVEVESAQNP